MEQLIPINDLVARVQSYNPRTNVRKLRAAYDYAKQAHAGQRRRSGEPYFTHPVAVAALLAEQRLDDATLITALLHDTVEDTEATYADITKRFGKEVAELVDGVTKLTNLQLGSTENKQAENFRKLFVAMSKDLRVILVKLFDRLHNMRTIKSLPPEKQQRKARETMDIYAPLAGPDGDAVDARRARGPRLPGAEPRGAGVDHAPLRQAAGRGRQRHRPDQRRYPRRNSPPRASPPRLSAGRRSPIRSGARWSRRKRASRACRTSTASG